MTYSDTPVDTKHVARYTHPAMKAIFGANIAINTNNEIEHKNYIAHFLTEAWRELERLELEFSRFIPSSDITAINALCADRSLPIGEDTWECLKIAELMRQLTNNAFNCAILPLLRFWAENRLSAKEEIFANPQWQEAMRKSQLDGISVHPSAPIVTVHQRGIGLDLGAIGKGYALDHMAKLADDWELSQWMFDGAQSSVLVRGEWPIALRHPFDQTTILKQFTLKDASLSGSGITINNPHHIINPRTGMPVIARPAVWAIASTAAISDALATAFMIMDPAEIEAICESDTNIGAMLFESTANDHEPFKLYSFGRFSKLAQYPFEV